MRAQLVPRSEPLASIAEALRRQAHRFTAIELNVVLQDGINDSGADLQALLDWGLPDWPVLLNPLLQAGREKVAQRTAHFAQALRAHGRRVHQYRIVGAAISRSGAYPMLTAMPLAGSRVRTAAQKR